MISCVYEKLVLKERSAANFLLSRLADHAQKKKKKKKKRKRHDLALENLQKKMDELINHRAKKVRIEKELMPWYSNRVFEGQKKRKKRQKHFIDHLIW